MKKWVIKDRVTAEALGIGIIESPTENLLSINLACIPGGMRAEEFIANIQKKGIVIQLDCSELIQ